MDPEIISLGPNAAELVFHNENGETIGQILTFNSRSKILNKHGVQDKETFENTSSAIGRIFVSFNEPGKVEPVWFCGTGFRVKNDLVMTAAHVIAYPVDTNAPKETQEMQRNLKFHKIYIFFGTDATMDMEINLSNIDNDERIFELVTYPYTIPSNHVPSLIVTGDNDQRYRWDTPNDLAILRFSGTIPTNTNILFPMIPEPNNQIITEIDHYVMGYPGHIELKRFVSDYGGVINDTVLSLYSNVNKESCGFQKKTVCVGKVTRYIDNILSHRCPTLRGSSGGIIASSQHERKFVGVHLGGTQETGNVALSVTHPLFWHVYSNYILDDQFIQDNAQHLQSYINHFQS
ncbi:hypothetical protein PPL_06840 [Heterostelium album PN500]|uniref:Serine protease n=1 Tax=Heterostelium pallidum (strain ATCC 26659 / Pp 5 / PN500) TaxID=670386 RepID=D3BDN8_HETP5|nr:hypothetical protein PPL_06840 [Heterostelium album PN500]EFA80019.1 hypothetical protein PPL_06840 [Heterostelium album PN500]|eukprot:XP_020432139.1 hypothetical protein PPL_06840 [Heterostelium album PN500]